MRNAAVASLAAFAASCSTGYFPRPSAGIRMTMSDGSPVFWKEGKLVQKGIFGEGLAAAMTEVPEAQEQARTWRSRNITGIVLASVGGALMIGGAAIIDPGAGFNARNTATFSMLLGGLVLALSGAITGASGQARLFDALNLYNDKVERR
jgi:hypothetical protein